MRKTMAPKKSIAPELLKSALKRKLNVEPVRQSRMSATTTKKTVTKS